MKQDKQNRIFIIGHPGAGKALLAKSIAEKLGWKFIDADFGLEFNIGRTINEILGSGAADFYRCQADVLRELLKKENYVVATDASIVCDETLRNLLADEFVVYLEVSTHVQLERTSRNPAPLLLVTDVKTLLDRLHAERDELFVKTATLTIDSDDSALDTHVSQIINEISSDHINTVNTKLQLDDKDLIFFHKQTHVKTQISYNQAICLKLLSQGKSSKEIAKELGISYRTVEGHIANMIELLGCTSSKELIALYHEKH